MKTTKIQSVVMCLSILTLLQSCNKKTEETTVVAQPVISTGKQVVPDNEKNWTIQSEQVGDVLVTSKVLTAEGEQKAKLDVKETMLESLGLLSTVNVTAFTLRGKSNTRTKQAVFVAPKLYFYQKSDRANVAVRKVGKNVLIPLQAILVDGFSREILAPDGVTKVQLPDSYVVNEEKLRTELDKIGYTKETTQIGTLDGCAKAFTISDSGHDYDVTPNTVKGADFCEMNKPFTLFLVVPEAEADYIINKSLYLNELNATATFAVKVGYLEADTHIQLDRSKVYESLQASLQGQYPPYAKGDVSAKLKSIIQDETLNIFIKGDRNDVITQLVKTAMDSFVTPFDLKASPDAKPECKDSFVCVSISYEKNKEQRTLEVSYQQYSTTMTEKTIMSSSKPQQILFPEIVFTSENNDQGQFIDNREEFHNERNLGVTVSQGTQLELFFTGYRYEMDNTNVEVHVSRTQECSDGKCNWNRYFQNVRREYRGVSFSGTESYFGNVHGNPDSQIVLKFNRADGTSTECSLVQLQAHSDNKNAYIVPIENTSSCQIFLNPENKKEVVSVGLINRLSDKNKLKAAEGRSAFTKQDEKWLDNVVPNLNESPLGGPVPTAIVELERALQIQVKIMVRKYTIE